MPDNGVTYAGVTLSHSTESLSVSSPTRQGDDLRVINDTELTYSDGWALERLLPRNLEYFCNTRARAKQAGAAATYRFSGCDGIVWYSRLSGNAGTADVSIDGRFVRPVVCQPDENGVVFDSGTLTYGDHTLTITVTSGSENVVEIDRLAGRGNTAGRFYVDSGNRSFVQYTAGFRFETSAQAGALAVADEGGEEWEVCFKGPSLRCYGETGPGGGVMSLYVDQKPASKISCRSNQPAAYALLFELTDLPAGRFVVVRGVTDTPGGRVALKHFEVEDPACMMVEMNRRTDEELARMRRHEITATEPADWRPIQLPVKVPEKNVQLGDGVFHTVFDRNVRYLKDSLQKRHWVDDKDPDRIWVDMLAASNEGRLLGGMGHSLRFAEIPEFEMAVDDILDVIDCRQYANGNGYMMPYDSANYRLSTDTWPGIMRDEQKNYDRAMLTKGLLAAGQAGHEKAYGILRRFYDWYNGAKEYLPVMLLGGMGIQGSIAGPMVYHSPIGKTADIQTNMNYYDMNWWLEYLALGRPEAAWRFPLNRPHNYLLTGICALFDIYKATGAKKYLDACLGAWYIYHEYFQIPGGGISLCEHFECKPKTYLLTNTPNNIYETCGSVFWIDLNHRFLQLWPENELYAAQIEQALFNIVLPAQGEDGRIRYFNQMNQEKYPPLRYNTCCEIQATALYGMLPQYIYSLVEDGVYVNLFADSTIRFQITGKPVELHTATAFPYGDEASFRISTAHPVRMAVRLRVPAWLEEDMDVTINEQAFGLGKPGSYLTIERVWADGDTIACSISKTWKYTLYTGSTRIPGAARYAFTYGPMLMAVRGPMTEGFFQAENEPSIRFDMAPDALLKRLKTAGKPCEFKIDGLEEFVLTPYFALQDGTFTCFPGMESAAK